MAGNVCSTRTIVHEASISAKSSGNVSIVSVLGINTSFSPHFFTSPRRLTSKTLPRPAEERHEAPSNVRQLVSLPSFGAEGVGVVAVKIFASMQVVYGAADSRALAD